MLWQEIRQKHPSKWLVMEAKKFHQDNDKFIVEDVEVLEILEKSFDAYDKYRKLRIENPHKELLFAKTEMLTLEIPITRWMGIRR